MNEIIAEVFKIFSAAILCLGQLNMTKIFIINFFTFRSFRLYCLKARPLDPELSITFKEIATNGENLRLKNIYFCNRKFCLFCIKSGKHFFLNN